MNKEEKEIKEVKKVIEERLMLSNKKVWKSMSLEERKAVVDKYYYLRSIDHLGLDKILDQNADLRINFYLIIFGLFVGIAGNLFTSALEDFFKAKFVGNSYYLLVISIFVFFVSLLIKAIKDISSENLQSNHVLERLRKITNKEN